MKMTPARWIAFVILLVCVVVGHYMVTQKAYEQCRLTETTAYCTSTIKQQTVQYYLAVAKGVFK